MLFFSSTFCVSFLIHLLYINNALLFKKYEYKSNVWNPFLVQNEQVPFIHSLIKVIVMHIILIYIRHE